MRQMKVFLLLKNLVPPFCQIWPRFWFVWSLLTLLPEGTIKVYELFLGCQFFSGVTDIVCGDHLRSAPDHPPPMLLPSYRHILPVYCQGRLVPGLLGTCQGQVCPLAHPHLSYHHRLVMVCIGPVGPSPLWS